MGGREFRAAGVVAILMAACAILVAWSFHLPVRDPDGVSLPTWFRLPAIVAGAIALDVAARWLMLVHRGGIAAGAALRAVLVERWNRDQIMFTRQWARHLVRRLRRLPQPQELCPVRDRPGGGSRARPPRSVALVGERPGRRHARPAGHRLGQLGDGRGLPRVDRSGAGQPGDRAGLDPPVDGRRVVRHGDLDRLVPGRDHLLRRSVRRPHLLLARSGSPPCRAPPTRRSRRCCSPTGSRCSPGRGTPRPSRPSPPSPHCTWP